MSSALLNVYHRLPAPVRSLAAALRGWQLRSWRYGPETDRLVEEALQRDQWSTERWKEWKEIELSLILERAATRVPFYRDQWAERRRNGDRSSWAYLENWPILEKESLREKALAFVADDRIPRKLFHSHTSGTTGKPLEIWYGKETARRWYAIFEARCRRWHGLSRSNRWAILGGQLVTSAAQRRPPFWVWNAPLNQLYMSSYHLAPGLMSSYLDALRSYRITYLYGYTSSIYELALEALRLGRSDLKMVVAFTNAEPVFDHQRQAIESAFQCPVRETYGMAEMAAGASECNSGSLHAWTDVSHLEVVDSETGRPEGSGDLISTGLLNADMPLIRYRIGDRVTLTAPESRCDCGCRLPMIKAVEGRSDDTLYTVDGRRIGRLDPVFKTEVPIREAQIIQESLKAVRVRYVPAPGFTAAAARLIVERLQARMGNVDVTLEELDRLPRTANGKFRAVICNLSIEDRQRLEVTGRVIARAVAGSSPRVS
jgi:phenylacetate-CoA ligase